MFEFLKDKSLTERYTMLTNVYYGDIEEAYNKAKDKEKFLAKLKWHLPSGAFVGKDEVVKKLIEDVKALGGEGGGNSGEPTTVEPELTPEQQAADEQQENQALANAQSEYDAAKDKQDAGEELTEEEQNALNLDEDGNGIIEKEPLLDENDSTLKDSQGAIINTPT